MTAEQDHAPQGGHTQTLGSRELEQDLATIEREARRIIELARAAPDLAVSQYPAWTLRDLLLHVAGVHGRTAEVCLSLPQERIPTPELPRRSDPVQWATVQLELMLEGLRRADTDAEVWTFVPDRRLAVWRRRMVVETGVHRWDAQRAAGSPEPLLTLVAGHGLDEFPDLYLPRLGPLPAVELRARDLQRSWVLGGGEPSVRVEGTASDLYLRLMARPGVTLPSRWERAVDGLAPPTKPTEAADRPRPTQPARPMEAR